MTTTSKRSAIASQFKQQALRVLESLLYPDEEGDGFAAIDQPVIVGQSEIHHGTNFNAITNGDRPVLYFMHAQNTALRHVQNWCGHQRAEHAAIGNREGAA